MSTIIRPETDTHLSYHDKEIDSQKKANVTFLFFFIICYFALPEIISFLLSVYYFLIQLCSRNVAHNTVVDSFFFKNGKRSRREDDTQKHPVGR